MTSSRALLLAVLLLAAGTLAMRLTGPALRSWLDLTPNLHAQIDRSVAVLFCALIVTSTLLDGDSSAGAARPAAVAAAAVLAWLRAPFVVVVLAAAATAAALRLIGLP
jgi:branched-subunit amino acid transport protein